MTTPVRIDLLTPLDDLWKESQSDQMLLREMADRAIAYLKSQRWYTAVSAGYMGVGIPGVLGLFLFRLDPPIGGTDEWIWVVVGDLPCAYFVTDNAPDPLAALGVYCNLMEEWADAVESRSPLSDVFPVPVPATDGNVSMLRKRVKFVRDRIIPNL